MKKKGSRTVGPLERATIIAERAAGKKVQETATLHNLSRRCIQEIMRTASELDIEAYRRFCGSARWGAAAYITAALQDLASTFSADAIAQINDPVERSKVLAYLARARRDLMDAGQTPVPAAPGATNNIQINLMSDEEWNARQAVRYPNAPAAALPK